VCSQCEEILKKPVLLPCGHSICENHKIEKIKNGSKKIMCNIETNVQCLKIGEGYESAKERFQSLKNFYELLTQIYKDPGLFVHDKISEIKNDVDLRREELKAKIDEDALELIAKLNEYEKECLKKIKDIQKNEIESKLKQWGDDVESLKKQLGCFQIEVDAWKKIDTECTSKLVELKQDLVSFEKELFLNIFDKFQDVIESIGNGFDPNK